MSLVDMKCDSCRVAVPTTATAGGVYCRPCFEEYAKTHAGICDFCNHPSPHWEYECADFQAWEVGQITGHSCGGWLACDACYALIEAEDWNGLQRRSAEGLPIGKVFPPEICAEAIRGAQKQFRGHKTGIVRSYPPGRTIPI